MTESITVEKLLRVHREVEQHEPHVHVVHPDGDRCLDCGEEVPDGRA